LADTKNLQQFEWDQPLLKRQALPTSAGLAEYREAGGFKGLDRALGLTPAETIIMLRDSGLRGRGPGARLVYEKWWQFLHSKGKGVIVADAREPDLRSQATIRLLSQDPWGLVEALAIAARVFRVETVRLRLPSRLHGLWPDLRSAYEEARAGGVLAEAPFSLDLYEPPPAPPASPHPAAAQAARQFQPPMPAAQRELSQTLQTWYQVGLALALGPENFKALGRNHQAGTCLITVGGAVKRPGLYEVPAGLAMDQMLQATGPAKPETIKGLALESGVCGFLRLDQAGAIIAPEEMMSLDLGATFNTLWVLDQNDCLVDLTRRAMTKVLTLGLEHDEASRQLTLHAIRLVTQLALRKASAEHLANLEEIAVQMRLMGCAAGWALKSSLDYFMDEWRIHLTQESCAVFDCTMPLVAPCQATCPAGIDIPSFMALVAAGRHSDAVEVIRQDNPLPYICGLVCPAPCESRCLRGNLDEPVSIRAMKAVAAKNALQEGGYPMPQVAASTGKKAAVIGAGPAGLTCAYFLAVQGHAITIYEAEEQAGGTAFSGIPAYRLPREVIQQEVQAILDLGVELRTGQKLGQDFTLKDLLDQGADAVFLGIGSSVGYRLGLPDEEQYPDQVLDGVSFLKKVAQGHREPPADDVVVVGGGNAAMDAARTCVRLGCRRVSVAYRRSRKEMPAHEHEVEEAMQEGVDFHFLAVPKSLKAEDGRVIGLECLQAVLGPADESGRRRPTPVEGSEFVLPAGAVIAAIGQKTDADCLDQDCGLELGRGSRIVTEAATAQSNLAWLFAGGDAVTGPATVIEAVAAGKRAANAMNQYLTGQPIELALTALQPRGHVEPINASPAQRANPARIPMTLREPAERIQDFDQVELGFDEQKAFEVAARCLRCDLCVGCGLCQTACAEMGAEALQFDDIGERLVFSDFLLPAKVCMGCGACANSCPTGALQVVDQDNKRRVVMTGTVLKESDLVACSLCGQPYASQVQLDKVGQRLGNRLHERVDEHICPACARLQQVREKWAHRFLRRGEH
jgi:NADH-quinone oxidoreductase subunit F